MDPLRFAIAAVPLAAYVAMIGALHLRRRPLVVTGGGDLAALGGALTGAALVGPIALFRPEAATTELGDFVWVFLLAFYWLWVALVTMLCRPRLVVYNATAAEVRPLLADAALRLDTTARWAGASLSLPAIGVHLYLDETRWLRSTTLAASGGEQDLAGWRKLARVLARSLPALDTQPNPWGLVALGAAGLLLVAASVALASDPAGVAVAWRQVTAF